MFLIPLEVLFGIWIAVVIAGTAAAVTSFRAGRRSMSAAMAAFAFGAFFMVSFYAMLLFHPLDYLIMIAWSRGAIGINALVILSGTIAAFIVTKGM